MRTLSTFIVLALMPTSLLAQESPSSPQFQFPVSGNVPQVCAVQAPRLAPGAQVNFRGLSGNTLQIDQMVDPATLATNAASVNVEFDAVCDYPHRVRVESQNNGLWQTNELQGAVPPGFTYAVPYQASLIWAGVNGQLNADAEVRRIHEERFNVDQGGSGSIVMRVVVEAGASNVSNNAPVLAGYYGDTLRLFVEPQ